MQTRNTIVMAVLLLVLGTFVYFYEIRGREAREQAEKQAELLLHFDVDQVQKLSVGTDDGTVVAEKADGSWAIVEPVAVPADGEAIDALVDRLHEAKQERKIVDEAEDLGPYGLDDPVVSIQLGLNDGTSLSLSLGKDTPVGYNVYARPGDGAVYSATRSIKSALDKKLFDLRDKVALHFEESDVRDIELRRGDFAAVLHRQRPAKSDEDSSDEAKVIWTASKPFEGPADRDTIDDLLSSLHTAQAKSFVLDAAPEPAQLAEYGLDKPFVSVTLRTEDGAAHTLVIGGQSEDPPGRYAMREGGTSVFVLGTDLLDDVPARADQVRNKQVVALDRDRVASIEVQRGGQTVRLEHSGTDWNITKPRPLKADASAASRLLSAIEDMRAEGFGTGSAGKPEMTVRVQTRDEDTSGDTVLITVGRAVQIIPLSKADETNPEPVTARYVTVQGDDTAYLVPDDDLEDLRVDLFTVRDKTLVQFTQTELTQLDISKGNETWTLKHDGEQWKRAGSGKVDTDAVSDLLWDLNFLRMEAVATEWEGQPPDLSAWGLATPRMHLVARTADGVVADVAIGNEVPGAEDSDQASERVWVRVGESPGVYEVGASLADAASKLIDSLQAH